MPRLLELDARTVKPDFPSHGHIDTSADCRYSSFPETLASTTRITQPQIAPTELSRRRCRVNSSRAFDISPNSISPSLSIRGVSRRCHQAAARAVSSESNEDASVPSYVYIRQRSPM